METVTKEKVLRPICRILSEHIIRSKTNYGEFCKQTFRVVKADDNDLGSLKHLYVISSFTGDVMEYSTVKGKVTSGGKRLSPKSVNGRYNESGSGYANYVIIANTKYSTDEVLDDGGSYGESMSYVYWFDAQGNYHQYFPSGGTYLHISDKPLRIKKSSMTFE